MTNLPTLYQDLATVVGGWRSSAEAEAEAELRPPPPRSGNSVNLRWLLLKRGPRDKSLGWRISYAIPPLLRSAQGLV